MADPVAATASASGGTATVLARRRFSVDEYHQMGEAGILTEDERVELLNGEILEMAPISSWHAACVWFVTDWFITHLGTRAMVWTQNPIRLGFDAEPEPDIALLRPRRDRYAPRLPGPLDVLLVIEIAETSLRHDSDVKVPRYAEAGIPEVWLVDLKAERVLVYRGPHGSTYDQVTSLGREGILSPEAFTELLLPVAELFGVMPSSR
ncbi:MAG: Uma2 family endonuclease [Dehalococcoidia bacterium]